MTATADALMAIFGFKRVEGNQMKTDRELLELAAKAAGYEVWQGRGHQADMLFMRLKKPDPTGKCSGREWNPLQDDGDALRLAVGLHLRVFPQEKCCYVESCPESLLGEPGVSELEMHGSDRYAATRRAIVRAAAAIGEGMQ